MRPWVGGVVRWMSWQHAGDSKESVSVLRTLSLELFRVSSSWQHRLAAQLMAASCGMKWMKRERWLTESAVVITNPSVCLTGLSTLSHLTVPKQVYPAVCCGCCLNVTPTPQVWRTDRYQSVCGFCSCQLWRTSYLTSIRLVIWLDSSLWLNAMTDAH